jgi:type I restriction enzyme S subunit
MKTATVCDASDRISEAAVANSATSVAPSGSTLLVVRSGILAHTLPVALVTGPVAFNQDIKAVVPRSADASAAYIYWFLRSKAPEVVARGVKKGATVHSVQSGFVEGLQVPVPASDEQQRIVDLLSRAEGIVRLRRQAQQKAAALIPAIFVDMFGDPATNPKGWPLASFGEVGSLDRGKSRHRPRDAAELYGGPYPFIQTGDVANSSGTISRFTSTYSEAGLRQSRLWPVGTLCITIAANIAKTGVLTFEACFPDSVVGFLPGPKVFTAYVQAWLGFLQPTLEANAPRAAQKNINLEILRGLPIPLPPLGKQSAFAQRAEALLSIQSQQAVALQKATAAFDALLAKAFSVQHAAAVIRKMEGALA